jgi:hypothetical protein
MQIYGYFAEYPACHLKKLMFFKKGGTSGLMPPSIISQGRTEEAGKGICPDTSR